MLLRDHSSAARGGDGDTLQKLGLDLALFVRAGMDHREDVTHVIRATRVDPGAAFSRGVIRPASCWPPT